MGNEELLILSGLAPGMRAKLLRLSRNMRQVDMASLAHVEPLDISIFEQDGLLSRKKRERITEALATLENETADDQ